MPAANASANGLPAKSTLFRCLENGISASSMKRPDLSARDRSIDTASALIALNQTIGMLHDFNIALDNGVTPAETFRDRYASRLLLGAEADLIRFRAVRKYR